MKMIYFNFFFVTVFKNEDFYCFANLTKLWKIFDEKLKYPVKHSY